MTEPSKAESKIRRSRRKVVKDSFLLAHTLKCDTETLRRTGQHVIDIAASENHPFGSTGSPRGIADRDRISRIDRHRRGIHRPRIRLFQQMFQTQDRYRALPHGPKRMFRSLVPPESETATRLEAKARAHFRSSGNRAERTPFPRQGEPDPPRPKRENSPRRSRTGHLGVVLLDEVEPAPARHLATALGR